MLRTFFFSKPNQDLDFLIVLREKSFSDLSCRKSMRKWMQWSRIQGFIQERRARMVCQGSPALYSRIYSRAIFFFRIHGFKGATEKSQVGSLFAHVKFVRFTDSFGAAPATFSSSCFVRFLLCILRSSNAETNEQPREQPPFPKWVKPLHIKTRKRREKSRIWVIKLNTWR